MCASDSATCLASGVAAQPCTITACMQAESDIRSHCLVKVRYRCGGGGVGLRFRIFNIVAHCRRQSAKTLKAQLAAHSQQKSRLTHVASKPWRSRTLPCATGRRTRTCASQLLLAILFSALHAVHCRCIQTT